MRKLHYLRGRRRIACKRSHWPGWRPPFVAVLRSAMPRPRGRWCHGQAPWSAAGDKCEAMLHQSKPSLSPRELTMLAFRTVVFFLPILSRFHRRVPSEAGLKDFLSKTKFEFQPRFMQRFSSNWIFSWNYSRLYDATHS